MVLAVSDSINLKTWLREAVKSSA